MIAAPRMIPTVIAPDTGVAMTPGAKATSAM